MSPSHKRRLPALILNKINQVLSQAIDIITAEIRTLQVLQLTKMTKG